MISWQAVTWDVARTGGFVAYTLVTVSVALGLVLSLRWRTRGWPRWASTDLHRYVTLLALVFTGVHTLAVWLDPFMSFGPGEVFVPLISHYRPIWMALGIVAAYLLLAIWLSERIQRLVGYGWWRRMHYLTFVVYGLVTVHGIAMGSDTRAPWGLAIYGSSVALVGALLAIRLLSPGPHMKPKPRLAAVTALITLVGVAWTVSGPLRPGWNASANNGHGSGARIALAQSSAPSTTGVTGLTRSFTATLNGSATQAGPSSGFGEDTVQLDVTLSGGMDGNLQITLQGRPTAGGGLAVDGSSVTLTPSGIGETCQGQVTSINGNHIGASCTVAKGNTIGLDIQLQVDNGGSVTGTVRGSPA